METGFFCFVLQFLTVPEAYKNTKELQLHFMFGSTLKCKDPWYADYHTESIFLLGHSIKVSLPLILWEHYLHYWCPLSPQY